MLNIVSWIGPSRLGVGLRRELYTGLIVLIRVQRKLCYNIKKKKIKAAAFIWPRN